MARKANFGEQFCDAFECEPEDFEKRVFWLCVYPHAVPVARLLWLLNRNYFQPDLQLIRQVKHLDRSDEVVLEIERFHYRRFRSGFGRGVLKVRVSGRRLMKLSGKVLATAASAATSGPAGD